MGPNGIIYRGKAGGQSCMYLALDALLGRKWTREGRDFCQGIIDECNGYPSGHNRIIPEFAPVSVWANVNLTYTQPERYAVLTCQGWRYRIERETQVVVCYETEQGTGHATCVPLKSALELRARSLLALIIANGTTMIKTRN